MPNNVTPDELNAQLRVYNLYCELLEEEKDKRETVKMKNENIKRLKEEIKELIETEEGEGEEAQRET